ncbi:MAG: hypothetical protein A2269_00280 [Lentisphaerae bacterium RIFOXYA12_FULL_60_10]|nr:MAG: hypothetical protein A2269_00280 [Lentisphaerae bacterium RIFOXYA12_FULL_60_10]
MTRIMNLSATVSTAAILAAASVWAQTPAAPAPAPATAPEKIWAHNLTIKGDVRFRYEDIDEAGKPGRQRDRFRARLSAEGKVNDTVKGGVAVSTGGTDPVSGNQTIGDGFQKKSFSLDKAYFKWSPNEIAAVTAGKMGNPFIGVQDLIWDGDLTHEGLALQAKTQLGSQVQAMANGGYMWVTERSSTDDDAMLYAGQAAMKFDFTSIPNEYFLILGGSLYQYDNLKGYALLDFEKTNKSYGNSTDKVVSGNTTNTVYKYEYELVELFGQMGFWVMGKPVVLFYDQVVNQEAVANDTGYGYGINIGKAKTPGTFEIGYNYREVEKDAVVGAFTDSDSWGGGSNGKGHKLMAKYQLAKNWQFGVTYFMNDKDLVKLTDYKRLQIDLAASF